MDLQPERASNMASLDARRRRRSRSGRFSWPGSRSPASTGACSSPASPSWRSRSSLRPAAFRTTATTASVCASGEALRAITRREVFRWLFLLELSDLLGDVFLGFLALYFVDDVGTSVATGGLAVAVWTGAGLAGAAAMIPLLRRIDGLRYLRASAAANAVLFVGFLLVPAVEAKLALVAAIALVSAGWYSVLQARLYGALAGASGLVR